MKNHPHRLFLDTNVFIVGVAIADSPEAAILAWAGFGEQQEMQSKDVVILVSDALFQQIARVGRRLRHKDWAGEIIGHIWRKMTVDYVLLDAVEMRLMIDQDKLPREDVTVFLTALRGRADCFVSANHELVRLAAEQTRSFECLTPAEFVEKYLR